MSFLSDSIQAVRFNLHGDRNVLVKALVDLKVGIRAKLSVLDHDKNLRIYDLNNGGVLRGPSGRCGNLELNGKVLCARKQENKNNQEVAYFRAVFNTPGHRFGIKDGDTAIKLIAYEAPLARKKNDANNTDIKSRSVACDLIGLTSTGQILCIEGKLNPKGRQTDMVHGLLESFAYGVCMDFLSEEEVRREELIKEIDACVGKFHNGSAPHSCNLKQPQVGKVAFSLAAPEKYYKEYFTESLLSPRFVKKRLKEAQTLLELFQVQEFKTPTWAGFMIFQPSECSFSKTDKGEEYVEPNFDPALTDVRLVKTIEELSAAVCKP